MLSKKTSVSRADLERPDGALWRSVSVATIELTGTPIGLQPSPYIVASWAQRPIGKVKRLRARSVHNGTEIAFMLEWDDPAPERERTDTNVFPDGAGLLFPLRGDAPIASMGTEEQPVNAWHWRADRSDRPRSNLATGLGTTRVIDEKSIRTAATWEGGRWRVVFSRALRLEGAEDRAVQFAVGTTVKVGFAVWEGGSGERAGLKAYSPEWHPVTIEA